MLTATKEFRFIAAHRVEGHPKCGKLHGHNYRVEVSVSHPSLDDMGFILDFGEMKRLFKPYFDSLDHTYMVSEANIEHQCIYYRAAMFNKQEEDLYILPIFQSSAELLAQWFKETFQQELVASGYGYITVTEVKVWETPTAYASS